MTTDTITRIPDSRAPRVLRPAIAAAAAAGTLPYLTMKLLWLTGSPVGLTDPAMLHSTSMTVLNAVTVAMDLGVIALAVALTAGWGRRLPAISVLLPGWVATGLLLPMVVVVLPTTVLSSLDGAPEAGMAGWVRPMVYGGFAWQGVFLLAAFALYARERWGAVVRDVRPPADGPLRDVVRTLAGGGAVTAAVSTILLVLAAATSGGGATAVAVAVVNGVLALGGAGGVVALLRGVATARGRVAAVVAGWAGSGSMFAWGLWTAVTTLGATDLSAGGEAAYGLGQLTGLLGGFALAAAGLVTLGARITR